MKTLFNYSMQVLLFSSVLIILTGSIVTGQDVILKKNGDEIKAKVEEVLTTEIKYRKFENLTGLLYSMAKSEIFMIKYENGSCFRTDYTHLGQRELVTGVYSINEKTLIINFEPGKTYYIRCSIMPGMGVQSQIEMEKRILQKEKYQA